MSRTFHTTPAFPRSLRGPRGGHVIAPTPCSECVAFASCRPGASTAPFGCDDWVDLEGRRVDPEADQERLLAIIEAREAGQHFDEEGQPVDLAAELDRFMDSAFDHERDDPDPTPCLECGGLPSECRPCGCPHVERDPGPLFKR